MVDDAELLRRYAEENAEPAFAELVRRHLDLVYSAALRRLAGDVHSATDVTQQVFTALARQAGALPRGVVLPAWLYNTTRNTAVDFIRAEQRRRAREQEAHIMQQLTSDSSTADWERLRPLLDAAMDELSERDREVVVLRFFARQPFADIGAAFRVSEDAARMRVDRALEKLRVLLARRGVASTAVALSFVLAQQSVLAAPAGMAASVAGSALAAGAAASPASGPVAAWIYLMSTSKMALGTAVFAIVVTLGGSIHAVNAIRTAEDTLEMAQRENDSLAAKREQLRAKAAAAENAAAEAELTAALARTTKANEQRQALLAAQEARAAKAKAFLDRHPELVTARIDTGRVDATGRYAPLFKLLKLSPAQIDRFTELRARGYPGAFVTPEGELLSWDTGMDRREADRQIRELLGEEGYRQYENSASLTTAWRIATDMGGRLYYTSTPLTAQQGEEMVRILSAHSSVQEGSSRLRTDWAATIAQAQAILAPRQIALLEEFRARDEIDRSMEEIRLRNNAAQKAGQPSGAN